MPDINTLRKKRFIVAYGFSSSWKEEHVEEEADHLTADKKQKKEIQERPGQDPANKDTT
jgi:hypothetical protein